MNMDLNLEPLGDSNSVTKLSLPSAGRQDLPCNPIPGESSRVDQATRMTLPLGEWRSSRPRFSCQGLCVDYLHHRALEDVNLEIGHHEVIALLGPSGSGRSTFLRCLNRMNDVIPGCRVTGKLLLDGRDIHAPGEDIVTLRARVGMVFQRPNPYPKSIHENIAYGSRIHGLASNRLEENVIVETVLRQVGLWKEVKGLLDRPALHLSLGQQQRLCMARVLATEPDVMLMDEPCASLDPGSASLIERLIEELRESYSIVLVTHSLQQAARVSQRTAFFCRGRLIEVGSTAQMFINPRHPLTDCYISGRYL